MNGQQILNTARALARELGENLDDLLATLDDEEFARFVDRVASTGGHDREDVRKLLIQNR